MTRPDSLWIMTRAEIDALRAKVKRSAEVLETTRDISDQRAREILKLRELLRDADTELDDLRVALAETHEAMRMVTINAPDKGTGFLALDSCIDDLRAFLADEEKP